jgi:hypothetical protein
MPMPPNLHAVSEATHYTQTDALQSGEYRENLVVTAGQLLVNLLICSQS